MSDDFMDEYEEMFEELIDPDEILDDSEIDQESYEFSDDDIPLEPDTSPTGDSL